MWCIFSKTKKHEDPFVGNSCFSFLVRVKGVEPSYPAWEAGVLPLNYTRIFGKVTYALPLVIKFIKIRVLRQPE